MDQIIKATTPSKYLALFGDIDGQSERLPQINSTF